MSSGLGSLLARFQDSARTHGLSEDAKFNHAVCKIVHSIRTSFPKQRHARTMELDLTSTLRNRLHHSRYLLRFQSDVPVELTQRLMSQTPTEESTLEDMFTNPFLRDIGISEAIWSELDAQEQHVLMAHIQVLISISACKTISDMGVGALAQRLRTKMEKTSSSGKGHSKAIVGALLDTMFEEKENTIDTIKGIMDPGGMQTMLDNLRLIAGGAGGGNPSPFYESIEAIGSVFSGLDVDESSQAEVLDMVNTLTPSDLKTMKDMVTQATL